MSARVDGLIVKIKAFGERMRASGDDNGTERYMQSRWWKESADELLAEIDTELRAALLAVAPQWRVIGKDDRRIQGLIVGHWHEKASAWVDVCQAYWQDDEWHNADTHMPIMYAPTHCMTPTPPPAPGGEGE